MKTRVLLINPPHHMETGIHNNQNCGLGLLSLAAYMPQEYECKIVDAEAFGFNYSDVVGILDAYKPQVVGITSTTLSFPAMIKISKMVKHNLKDVHLMVGGSHVSAMPEKAQALTGADCVVVGEGETVIKDALQKDGIIQGSPVDFENHRRLPREIHEPQVNSEWYIGNDPVYATPETVVMWERGCPHNCNFCSTRLVHGQVMRRRNITNIMNELKILQQMGIRGLFVYDDELIGVNQQQHDWLMELLTTIDYALETKGWFDFKTQGRCNKELIDDTILQEMKQAGFKALMMGCESGSQRVLDQIGKNLTIEDIKHSIKKIHENGLHALCYWMVGNETETSKDVEQTVKLMRELKPYTHRNHVTILNPLPATPIYDKALKNGWITDHDYRKWGQHGNVVMEGSGMTASEILSWEQRLRQL